MNNSTGMTADVDHLNSLLRGEIAAVETYDQAIDKLNDSGHTRHAEPLRRIREDHAEHVANLRAKVKSQGGEPSDGAGAWGVFANAVQGAAKLMGPQTALAALKQGEQHGINDYERTLKDDDVSADTKQLIRGQLLPRCQQHLGELDSLMQQIDQTNQ